MAARINTKFVLILIIAVGMLGTGLGGWIWYRIRHDAAGKIALAEQFLADGDYRNAEKFFGRAVGIEPGNLEFVAQWEDAIRRIVPNTDNEARELYLKYLEIRRYPSDQYPFDAKLHEYYIEEVAMATNITPSYATLYDRAATRMLETILPPDPGHLAAQLHRGIARFGPSSQAGFDEREIDAGEDALLICVEEEPKNAVAWSTLVRGRVARAVHQRAANEPVRAAETFRSAQSALEDARIHVADDPLLTLAEVEVALHRRTIGEAIDTDVLRTSVSRLRAAALESDEPEFIHAVRRAIFRSTTDGDYSPLVTLYDNYGLRHPKDFQALYYTAWLRQMAADFEGARSRFEQLLEEPLLPVSFMSQQQWWLRREAASELVAVALAQFETADPADQETFAQRMEAAREALAENVAEPENDSYVIEADARIAYSRGHVDRASALFDRLVTEFDKADPQTILSAAISLERQDLIGRALSHVNRGLEETPNHIQLLERKAMYLTRLNDLEGAEEAAKQFLELAPNSQRAKDVLAAIQGGLSVERGEAASPERRALEDAARAVQGARFEEALQIVRDAYEQIPDSRTLLNALARLEWTHGDKEVATALVDEGLVRFPGFTPLRDLQRAWTITDPIQRQIEAIREKVADPIEQDIRIAMRLFSVKTQLLRQAEAARLGGDEATEAQARESIAKVIPEIESRRTRLERDAPRHPMFIEFRFTEALTDGDWPVAERMVTLAGEVNVDQAGGLLYRGRYELHRRRFDVAAETLREASAKLPFSANAHLWHAMALENLGRYTEALDAYAAAYSNNPNDASLVGPYVNLLQMTGDADRALVVLQAARRISASAEATERLRNRRLAMEVKVGDPAVALRDRRDMHENRRSILATDPIAKRNARELIDFLVKQTPTPNTILDAKGQPRYTPREWARLTAAEQTQAQRVALDEWTSEVDDLVEDLGNASGRDLDWHSLKATVLSIRGEVDAGESVLREYLSGERTQPEQLFGHVALAIYLQAIDRVTDAIAAIEEAKRYQDPARLEADHALASLLVSLNRYAAAYDVYREISATAPSADVDLAMIRCLGMSGRVAEAREAIAATEFPDEMELTVAILGAALMQNEIEAAAASGREADATRLFEELGQAIARLHELAPTSPAPYLTDARRLLNRSRRTGEGDLLELALRELDAAETRVMNGRAIALLRIEILQAMGNRNQAIFEYQDLLADSPDHRDARVELVNLFVQDGRVQEAIEVLGDAVRRSPASAFWHERYGDLIMRIRGDAHAAANHYRLALESVPSPGIVGKVANALLTVEPPDAPTALRYLADYASILGDSPEPIAVRARAHAVLGDSAAAMKDLRFAYAQFGKYVADGRLEPVGITTWVAAARNVQSPDGEFTRTDAEAIEALMLELANGTLDLYELRALALLWRESGDESLAHAIDLQRQALSLAVGVDEGRRPELLFTLGSMLHSDKQDRAALDAYEEVVDLDPTNHAAINNVAYFLSETMQDPEAALPYARRALDLRPADWSLLDTYGWILYRTGAYAEAKQYLFQSVQIDERAVNNYHLAAVYAKEGDVGNAHRHIQRALELEPDPQTRADIDRLADDI